MCVSLEIRKLWLAKIRVGTITHEKRSVHLRCDTSRRRMWGPRLSKNTRTTTLTRLQRPRAPSRHTHPSHAPLRALPGDLEHRSKEFYTPRTHVYNPCEHARPPHMHTMRTMRTSESKRRVRRHHTAQKEGKRRPTSFKVVELDWRFRLEI